MIDRDTIIHILDIDEGNSIESSVSSIFQKYSMYMDDEGVVDFSSRNIKIKDWTGWTQLMSIQRIKSNGAMNWKILTPTFEKLPEDLSSELILKGEVLPIYSHDDTLKGFHGEVKYKYSLSHIDDISNEIVLRARIPRTTEWQRFIVMGIGDYTSLHDDGFVIVTKSGFYNANIYHLCSSDTKIDGSKELWK